MAFSRGPSIVTDGLVLALDAANHKSYPGSGTVWRDLSGNGNNGTLTNGPTYLTNNGGVFLFDGTDDIATFPALYYLLDDKTYGTWEVWVKDYGYVAGSYNTAIGSRIGKDLSICRDNTTTGIAILANTTTGGNLNWSTGEDFVANQWQHLVCTYNNGILKFYLDGVYKAQNTSRSGEDINASTTYATGIGGDVGNSTRDWNGEIGLGRIWNQVLSDEEVQQNYNATKSRFGL